MLEVQLARIGLADARAAAQSIRDEATAEAWLGKGLRRVILGSVAERVLNTALRPVLLVRPTDEELRASAPLSSTA